MQKLNRRKFIKLMGGSVGGVILSTSFFGCVGGGSSPSNIPNGYRFYRLKSPGETVGEPARNLTIKSFRGTAHFSGNGIITFDAFDADKRAGIFQLGVDLDAPNPEVYWGRTALMTGETLADGRTVGSFKSMDVNSAGSIAVDIVATTPSGQRITHFGSGLYLDVQQQGFEPVFIYGQRFLNESVSSAGILGDIDLHEDNEILVAGNFNPVGDDRMPGQGVLYLPGASVDSATMLIASGDFVPSASHSMESIGLLDMHDNGNYVIQGQARPLSQSGANITGESPGHPLMLTGNVNTSEHLLLGAAPELGSGDIIAPGFYGPRMSPSGEAYGLTWDEAAEKMQLYYGNQPVIGTGDITAAGESVLLMSTGSVGSDGALYYTVTSVDSADNVVQDLVVFNGTDHSVLLSRGAVLTDGGAPVDTIYFGTTTKQVDAQGRLVLYCTFTDGTSALVIGLPS